MKKFLVALLFVTACTPTPPPYEIVLSGGRVMDPASDVDAVLNVGIKNGRIATITEDAIDGERVIDASGLVVAPGFIDMHVHPHGGELYRMTVQDGVTSALELEVGTGDIDAWYAEHEGGQYVNYGVSIGHIPVRITAMNDPSDFLPSGPAKNDPATDEQIAEMERLIREGLDEGAVAVGFGTAYTPGASLEEFETLMRVAAERGASAHIHVRTGLAGLDEAIDTAARTGTALHVVHANSSGAAEIEEFLAKIEDALMSGQDVTTEAYPYSAGQTSIDSALFDDWESYPDEQFETYQWPATGERLTRETFAKYRAQGGSVIIHNRTEEMTRTAIASPLTMIASDGSLTHPRGSGTYAKVLGKYVREEGLVELMDALRRMTILPAQRLERYVPAMLNKGRVQEGKDADITLFDPDTVIDKSTYTNAAVASEGIPYVLVNGVVVVDGGELVSDARAGEPIRR